MSRYPLRTIDEAEWRAAWEAGTTCRELAERFGTSRSFADSIIHTRFGYPRPHRFGIRPKQRGHIREVEERAFDSPPLPPGSPLTWDTINEGTMLQGMPYPAQRTTRLVGSLRIRPFTANPVTGDLQFAGVFTGGD